MGQTGPREIGANLAFGVNLALFAVVMELCKEDLMGRIFQNRNNIPSLPLTPGAARIVIRWARNIANALEFIHS